MVNDLCTECTKRIYCSSLCPEAELYAKQDDIGQRELTIGIPRYGKWPTNVEKSLFTPMELQILSRLLEGKGRKEIAEELEITRHSLKLHIQRLKSKRLKSIRKVDGE